MKLSSALKPRPPPPGPVSDTLQAFRCDGTKEVVFGTGPGVGIRGGRYPSMRLSSLHSFRKSQGLLNGLRPTARVPFERGSKVR